VRRRWRPGIRIARKVHPYGGTRAGLSAIGELNRTDWGITANMALPTGSVVVGEKIQLVIEVEASLKTQ
jgi:polyisoprenoid-binding protein YceI